jgi:glutamine---fructose-6-phosphate transaminase (isomerizing)
MLFVIFTEQINDVLKSDTQIRALAQELYQHKSLLVMGRGYNYATCLEGALVSSVDYI